MLLCHEPHLEDPRKTLDQTSRSAISAQRHALIGCGLQFARRRAVSVTARDYRTAGYSTAIHNASFQVSAASNFFLRLSTPQSWRSEIREPSVETSNRLILVTLFSCLCHVPMFQQHHRQISAIIDPCELFLRHVTDGSLSIFGLGSSINVINSTFNVDLMTNLLICAKKTGTDCDANLFRLFR